MDWDRIASFFRIEAVATYIASLFTVAFWIHEALKSKQGRYVVCTQSKPVSHLSAREREWVKVEFSGDDRRNPVPIDTLSQAIIAIKNASDADTLNDVQLKFRVLGVRVLKAWWEKGPDYLLNQSSISISLEDGSSTQAEGSVGSSWLVEVTLPDLKSFKKYKETFRLGILADGYLRTIEMLPGGSKAGVTTDQVWTAKFVSHGDSLKKKLVGPSNLVLAAMFGGLLVVGLWGFFTSLNLRSLGGFVIGFSTAGLLGSILQRLRFARVKMESFG